MFLFYKKKVRMNEQQKQILDSCYNELKVNIEKIKESYKAHEAMPALFYMFLIAMTMKQVETSVLKGGDKKKVAIELGSLLIKDIIEDKTKEEVVLGLYTSYAETAIDGMIDLASSINKKESKAPKACCVIQ